MRSSVVMTRQNTIRKITAAALPPTTAMRRCRSGSDRLARAITMALSPDSRTLMPMICSRLTQKRAAPNTANIPATASVRWRRGRGPRRSSPCLRGRHVGCDEHRYAGAAHQLVGRGSEHDALRAGDAPPTHDDQVGTVLACDVEDHVDWRSRDHIRLRRALGRRPRLSDELVQFFLL